MEYPKDGTLMCKNNRQKGRRKKKKRNCIIQSDDGDLHEQILTTIIWNQKRIYEIFGMLAIDFLKWNFYSFGLHLQSAHRSLFIVRWPLWLTMSVRSNSTACAACEYFCLHHHSIGYMENMCVFSLWPHIFMSLIWYEFIELTPDCLTKGIHNWSDAIDFGAFDNNKKANFPFFSDHRRIVILFPLDIMFSLTKLPFLWHWISVFFIINKVFWCLFDCHLVIAFIDF